MTEKDSLREKNIAPAVNLHYFDNSVKPGENKYMHLKMVAIGTRKGFIVAYGSKGGSD